MISLSLPINTENKVWSVSAVKMVMGKRWLWVVLFVSINIWNGNQYNYNRMSGYLLMDDQFGK